MKNLMPLVPPTKGLPERRVSVLTLLNPWNSSYEIYRLSMEGLQLVRVIPGVTVKMENRGE